MGKSLPLVLFPQTGKKFMIHITPKKQRTLGRETHVYFCRMEH